MVSWLITGDVRTYSTRNGDFKQISPLRPVFSGGPGAVEIVAHINQVDLDSGPISGGTFWRFTPMVNWYLSDHVRLEIAYGYGSLNRFNTVGKTHFFQTRLQFQL
jgi:phosphate-selective porin OprO/OprP